MVDLAALKAELTRAGRVTFAVKVIPKSSRNEIVGALDEGCLKLKITAPPERGKANAEVRQLLAGEFGVAKSAVEIVRGETSPLKQIVITA